MYMYLFTLSAERLDKLCFDSGTFRAFAVNSASVIDPSSFPSVAYLRSETTQKSESSQCMKTSCCDGVNRNSCLWQKFPRYGSAWLNMLDKLFTISNNIVSGHNICFTESIYCLLLLKNDLFWPGYRLSGFCQI